MSIRLVAWLALALLSAAAVVQNALYWRQLPERVATHFDMSGEPDAWMGKTNAVLMMSLFQLGLPLFLIGITALTPRLPPSMINIPNRAYWLRQDRIASTLAYLGEVMTWMAVLVAAFLMALNHLTFVANRDGQALDSRWFVWAMFIFLVGLFALIGKLYWNLRLPADAA